MHERLLILEPDAAQARRLGRRRVTAANAVGLALGLIVALGLLLLLAT